MKRLITATFAAALIALTAQPADAAGGKGDRRDWTQLDGSPTFDPCSTITWSHPHDGSVLERAFARAIRKARKFSGLTFQRVDQGGAITVAVRPQAQVSAVVAGVAYADNVYSATYYEPGVWWIVGSTLVIADTIPGSVVVDAVVMHELGHALGLGHARHKAQIMYAGQDHQMQYGAGDRAGLAYVGHVACKPPVAKRSNDDDARTRSMNVA